MTEQEQRLADDKMRAEIFEMQARALKQMRESAKIDTENKWYPAVVGAGLMAAAVALAKFFL